LSPASDPELSVVVAIISDTMMARARTDDLAGCLQALQQQIEAPSTEVIVPHADTDGIDALAQRFPHVRFLPVVAPEVLKREPGSREHHDVLRAHGLAAARGRLVALLEDQGRPCPRWCAHILAAHRDDDAAIGGAIENGIDRPLNWAVYFCDFARYQNPLPAGPSPFASDANTSYKRTALESVRPLWERSFREVVVNEALVAAGMRVSLRPDIVVHQHRSGLALRSALAERFVWGRSYAMTRSALLSRPRRFVYALLSPLLPPVMLARMAALARQRGRHFGKFLAVIPLLVLLTCSWSAGECAGYLSSDGGA
jgi:hypothetical protein